MKCPNCEGELQEEDVAYLNVLTYGNTATMRTECCGSLVSVTRITRVAVFKYNGQEKKDSWGR